MRPRRISSAAMAATLAAVLAFAAVQGITAARTPGLFDVAQMHLSGLPGVPTIHFDSVEEALKYNPLLTSLHKALNATDLLDELNKPDYKATVIAPTNQAFKALLRHLDVTEDELLHDEKLLTRVLSYHVIPDKSLKVDDINDGEEEETLLAKYYLTFHKETYLYFLTKVTITGADPDKPATVLVPDIEAGQVVMHVVSGVLLPEDEEDMERQR